MSWIAAIGLLVLQVAAYGKLGLAILPICLLWCLVGLNFKEDKNEKE